MTFADKFSNFQAVSGGVLGDALFAVLAVRNCVHSVKQLQKVAPWVFKGSNWQLQLMFFMTMFAPVIRLLLLLPAALSIYRAQGRLLPAITVPGNGF